MTDDAKSNTTEEDARFTANLLLLLMVEIKRYKAVNFDKSFKVNASGPNKLSERQFQVLFFIEYLRINTLSQISDKLELSGSNISTVISKLVKNGLLRKKYPDYDDDKRKIYFYLTSEGKHELQNKIEQMTAYLAAFYEGLDATKKQNFLEAYNRLITLLPKDTAEENPLPIDRAEGSPVPVGMAEQIAKRIVNGMIAASTLLQKSFSHDPMEEERKDLLAHNHHQVLFIIDTKKINNLRELSRTIGISESALSTTLSKLDAEGLVCKEHPEADEDGRKMTFYITEKGREKLLATRKKIISFFVSFYNTLQADQQENLYEGIKNLYIVFREEPI